MPISGARLAGTEGCGGRRIRRGLRCSILVAAVPVLVAACGTAASTAGTGTYPTGPGLLPESVPR